MDYATLCFGHVILLHADDSGDMLRVIPTREAIRWVLSDTVLGDVTIRRDPEGPLNRKFERWTTIRQAGLLMARLMASRGGQFVGPGQPMTTVTMDMQLAHGGVEENKIERLFQDRGLRDFDGDIPNPTCVIWNDIGISPGYLSHNSLLIEWRNGDTPLVRIDDKVVDLSSERPRLLIAGSSPIDLLQNQKLPPLEPFEVEGERWDSIG